MLRRILASLALFAALLAADGARASQATWVTPSAPLPMTSLATFLNNGLQAVGTFNAGASSPTIGPSGAPIANMCWWNTNANPNVFECYDGASWDSVFNMNTSTHNITMSIYEVTLGGCSLTAAEYFCAPVGAFENDGIGATSTNGLTIRNTTAAANNAQQWSPRLHFVGQGWKTNSTAASETAEWIEEIQPVQGAATPTFNFVYSYQINGGGYGPVLTYAGLGGGGINMIVGNPGASVGSITIASPTANSMTLGNAASANGAATFPSGTYNILGDSPTATLTNKTLTSSTNVLGGVTMTLGSDADGDIYYRSGGALTRLAKGANGTVLEVVSGTPAWASVSGAGTMTSALVAASGGATTSGTCNSTTAISCTIAAPGGFLNALRNNSLSAWFHGTSITVTTSGGWCAEGIYVVPTGASVTCLQSGTTIEKQYANTVTGAASVTDVKIRFVVEGQTAAILSSATVTFQIIIYNNTGGSITPTLTTRIPTALDNWTSSNPDLAAVNLQACGNTTTCTLAYTFTSGAAQNGYEFVVDLGNNFSTSGKDVQIEAFDARVTPGVSTGLNANPPPMEVRDPATDIAWNERFYQNSYDNGVASGTATHTGMIATSGITVSTDGGMGVAFRTTMRCDPPVGIWDGAGTLNKLSYWNGAAWTDGQGAPSVQGAGHHGFVLYSNNAANLVGHYSADCTISGG